MVTFGETDWDEPVGGSGKNRDDFLNFKKDGAYEIRICSAPFKFSIHWFEDANGKTSRINCAGPGCRLCKEAMVGDKVKKAQDRYAAIVYSHDSKAAHLAEFGTQVYSGIKALKSNKRWGDPSGYDIIIDKDKNRGVSSMYLVTPGGRDELSAEARIAVAEFKGRVNPLDFTSPASEELIARKFAPGGGGASRGAAPAGKVAAAKPAVAAATEDEFEF